jgi:hypothetical protein
VLDVPVDAFAQQHCQMAVPAGQHRAEFAALVAARAADEQHGQAGLKLVPGAGKQRVRVVAGDAEHIGDLGGLKALAQLEFDDLALTGVQASGGFLEQGLQLGPLGILADVPRVVGHVDGLVKR